MSLPCQVFDHGAACRNETGAGDTAWIAAAPFPIVPACRLSGGALCAKSKEITDLHSPIGQQGTDPVRQPNLARSASAVCSTTANQWVSMSFEHPFRQKRASFNYLDLRLRFVMCRYSHVLTWFRPIQGMETTVDPNIATEHCPWWGRVN